MSRRVVITGLGAVSSIGANVAEHLASLKAGKVGIGPTRLMDGTQLRVKCFAEAADFNPDAFLEPRQRGLMDRNSELALAAAREAVAQAGDPLDGVAPEKAGVIYGASVGFQSIEDGYHRLNATPPGRPHPFTVPRSMPSSSASQISMAHRVLGPSFSVASACSSASHAIGLSFHMIRSGLLDVALSGGSEAPHTLGFLKAWEALRVLSPDGCRPFSADRNGLVLGEAGGVVVLEELERARGRGAPILAEVVGFGMSADGNDLTAPDGTSTARAMRLALADAGLAPEAIDYVSAHGTGTVLNDKTETAALRTVFGAKLDTMPVSSTKSMHGHCLGAAGALGVIGTVLAMREGFVPPTMGYRVPDPDCALDCVPNAARDHAVGHALVNAFAFGGLNAVLALKAWH
ncbi:beta-ketoacyl-[acyl-carrier-protein] synthase family protein [Xanthobacter tagetidis]|uniref:Nodulation protein E n=1 Tax=Xanthobacter tagetidis TaxID=60216 RepID=A0A3L7AJQ9_9HYPH|nr:beta-ketoacyl-[acyl-carrier-protein] synthase family protein [Xanthobacter tagetidis]MBB6306980.1 nodulation protein E [Xanthobacter tagetidis]RLP79960.1 beta-ketoacyl-[acyl-carrier-protein] synthase family protein [Xanthobacter tagetidis]